VRWRSAILVLAAAGGCSFPHGSLSENPDAPMPDVPDVDTDGDGLADRLDNCPNAANGDQKDHDADSHGDACDRCPHLASATDPDEDNDGVGDACDPRPMTAGDHIALWEPFDAAAVPAWSRMGDWSEGNGAVTQSRTPGEAFLLLPTVFAHPYVMTSVTANSLVGANAQIGMCTSLAAGQYYCCILKVSGPTLASTSYGNVTNFKSATWTGQFAQGSSVTLEENEVGAHDCIARQSATSVTATTTLGATSGQFQLYMQDAAATYDYVFAVEIGQ
jgi:hypothetical protein